MCVIAVCDSERPTGEQVSKMYEANDHGAGIAWIVGDTVHWKKGMKLDEIQKRVAETALPFVIHFRIPSCGGDIPQLCHPFPVDKNTNLDLEGKTKGAVLFHNGHWNAWKTTMLDAAVRVGAKIPVGKWSDSRSMAWMAAHFGVGMLEFIGEKAVVFSANDCEIFGDYGWAKISEGIWVSNKTWDVTTHMYRGNRREEKKADADKEDHTRLQRLKEVKEATVQDGPKKAQADGTLIRSGSSTHPTSGGISPKQGSPFGFYMKALRDWQMGKLSKKAFKRKRKQYETWCLKTGQTPQDRPANRQITATVH